MRKMPTSLRALTLPLLLVSATLTACTDWNKAYPFEPEPDKFVTYTFNKGRWKPVPRPLDAQVEPITHDFRLLFASGGTQLNDAQVEGRRTMTSHWMDERIRPAMALVNEIAPFYGSGPLFDPEEMKRID